MLGLVKIDYPSLTLPNTPNTVTVLCVGTDVVVKAGRSVIFSANAETFFGTLQIEGGSKTDKIILDSSLNGRFTSRLIVNGNDGNDTLNASRVNFDVVFNGGAGHDILAGGGGNDS